jgi:uncharacterized protein YecT (DUF1311 family)
MGIWHRQGKTVPDNARGRVLLLPADPQKASAFQHDPSLYHPCYLAHVHHVCPWEFTMPFGIGSRDCTQERSSMKTIFAATGVAALVLSAGLSLAPRPAAAASFDCEKTDLVADEKVICDTRTLNDADVKMVTTFDILTSLLAMGNRDQLRQEQSDWLKKRRACEADVQCLTTAYAERMKQLQEAFSGLSKEPL